MKTDFSTVKFSKQSKATLNESYGGARGWILHVNYQATQLRRQR